MRLVLITFILAMLNGCLGIPQGIQPVGDFNYDRYLGKWYEIARLDHSFERGLDKVTAEYSLREDGGLTVINKGFSTTENKWKEAKGKAYFVRNKNEAYLKVSFFGPFYSSYVVFELDKENYQYAFVSGYNQSYLWLLSRSPKIDDELIERFLKRSKELGFDTSKLLFIAHN